MSQDRRPLRPILAPTKDRAGDKDKNDLVQLCGFKVGDEEYALGIERIKEIINPLLPAPRPDLPRDLRG